MPITPPLPGDGLRRATFSPNGQRLVTIGKDESLRLWDLSPDRRPVADLIAQAEVLSSLKLHPASGGLVPLDTPSFRAAWRRLH